MWESWSIVPTSIKTSAEPDVGLRVPPARKVLPELAAEIRTAIEQADRDWHSALGHAIRAGELLIEAKARCKHGEWLPWLKANSFQQQRASEFMRVAKLPGSGSFASLNAALKLLAEPRERAGATRETAGEVRATDINGTQATGERTPRPPQFNRVNDNIGWARWSWNPVTGCLHNCDYCYARAIAERFYPQGFAPTFLPERLSAPQHTKLPKDAGDDPAWRRVFTCSMADLFGKWVPKEWIDAVFEQIVAAPQWQFLCLTKFPQRLATLEWPENAWVGTTVDKQHRAKLAERSFAKVKAGVKWLSCEPLLEPLQFSSLEMFDWVVIGASTGATTKEYGRVPPFAPSIRWVADLIRQAEDAGCKVYTKHNLHLGENGVGPGMQPIQEWPQCAEAWHPNGNGAAS